jgi:hypothetical protein
MQTEHRSPTDGIEAHDNEGRQVEREEQRQDRLVPCGLTGLEGRGQPLPQETRIVTGEPQPRGRADPSDDAQEDPSLWPGDRASRHEKEGGHAGKPDGCLEEKSD